MVVDEKNLRNLNMLTHNDSGLLVLMVQTKRKGRKIKKNYIKYKLLTTKSNYRKT